MTKTISNNTKEIVLAIAGGAVTTKEIAEHTGISAGSVTSTLTRVKGTFINRTENGFELTEAARKAVGLVQGSDGRKARTAGKALEARAIYAGARASGAVTRKEVITRYVNELGLSPKAAATYY